MLTLVVILVRIIIFVRVDVVQSVEQESGVLIVAVRCRCRRCFLIYADIIFVFGIADV